MAKKNYCIAALLLAGLFLLFVGCASTANFSSVKGKDWKLAEVKKGDMVWTVDRKRWETEGIGDFYTIKFDEKLNGKGAPNIYTVPYEAGKDSGLTIQQIAGTLTASTYDPQYIPEHDYFQYLAGVTSWKLEKNRLEMHSSDADGNEIVLAYVR